MPDVCPLPSPFPPPPHSIARSLAHSRQAPLNWRLSAHPLTLCFFLAFRLGAPHLYTAPRFYLANSSSITVNIPFWPVVLVELVPMPPPSSPPLRRLLIEGKLVAAPSSIAALAEAGSISEG